jgi:hypothetical protein
MQTLEWSKLTFHIAAARQVPTYDGCILQEVILKGPELSPRLLAKGIPEVLKVAAKVSTAGRDEAIARHADATLTCMALRYDTEMCVGAYSHRCLPDLWRHALRLSPVHSAVSVLLSRAVHCPVPWA